MSFALLIILGYTDSLEGENVCPGDNAAVTSIGSLFTVSPDLFTCPALELEVNTL